MCGGEIKKQSKQWNVSLCQEDIYSSCQNVFQKFSNFLDAFLIKSHKINEDHITAHSVLNQHSWPIFLAHKFLKRGLWFEQEHIPIKFPVT